MITLIIELSFGTAVFTEEDIKVLKPELDKLYVKVNQDDYFEIKQMSSAALIEKIEKMTDEELLRLAKANDLYKSEKYRPDSFTQKIYRELFKRKGNLGYKSLNSLSSKQRQYLINLGLKDR